MKKIAVGGLIVSLFLSSACSLFDDKEKAAAVPGVYDVTSTLTDSTGDCSASNTPDVSSFTVEIAFESGDYIMYGLDEQDERKVILATSSNGLGFENSGPVMEIGSCTFYQKLVYDVVYDTDQNEITTLFGTSSVRLTASCDPGECNEFSEIEGAKR